MKKKALIISGIALGSIAVGFLAYRIYSRWNKTVVKEENFTMLVKNSEPSKEDTKTFYENEESNLPEPQEWSSGQELVQQELDAANAMTDMGDY